MVGEEYIFKRANEQKIRGIHWPNPDAKAIMIIVTGMEEHASRYEPLGSYLVDQGFELYALDHYGQGANAIDVRLRGVWPVNAFEMMVDIIDELIMKVKAGKPVYLFGHSLGSFVSQRYIQKYGAHIEKVILCGTNGPDGMVKIGNALASIIVGKAGYKKKSKLFNDMVFGAYAKSIPNAKTEFDWLSYNQENVTKYIADPYCGYGSTGGFYREFLKGLAKLHRKKEIARIPKQLPILMIAGAEDPVGKNGSGVVKLEALYRKMGLKSIRTIIYEGMRHEILNELEHEKVYKDLLHFLNS